MHGWARFMANVAADRLHATSNYFCNFTYINGVDHPPIYAHLSTAVASSLSPRQVNAAAVGK